LVARRREVRVTDKNDVVIAIAATLYASRATDDALRAEPDMEATAAEAWDLYYKLERAVRGSSHRHGDGGHPPPADAALSP
jgi:IS4 transposase